MALYDYQYDWYDLFLPGSNLAGMVGALKKPKNSPFFQNVGELSNNITGVTSTQKFNADEAQRQRDWEEAMSSSAYQRSMSDLKAAGLNPALIYGTGGQSSTPSGSAASSPGSGNPLIGNLASILNASANLMNSSTRQLANDRYSKHLDYKERDQIQEMTNKLYDNAGNLIGRFVSNSYRYNK